MFEPNGLEKSDTCFTNNTFSTATVIINLENYLWGIWSIHEKIKFIDSHKYDYLKYDIITWP